MLTDWLTHSLTHWLTNSLTHIMQVIALRKHREKLHDCQPMLSVSATKSKHLERLYSFIFKHKTDNSARRCTPIDITKRKCYSHVDVYVELVLNHKYNYKTLTFYMHNLNQLLSQVEYYYTRKSYFYYIIFI